MYFLEIDLRINTTINFKDFKYALEKYELDFDWESGFNEFWDTKNDVGVPKLKSCLIYNVYVL